MPKAKIQNNIFLATINYKCLESRLRNGWSTEKLLTTPVKGSNNDK